jgi:predicted RNase H-like nuclease
LNQPGLFEYDAIEGERQKDEGMAAAAMARAELLTIAREIARHLAYDRWDRCISADDVLQHMEIRRYPSLGPAAGSLFQTPEWEFTGQRIKSVRISNHAREIKVWRLLT